MKVTFLEAVMPLTKTFFRSKDGSVTKDPYPNAKKFSTHTHEVSTLTDLFHAIQAHSKLGHCLFKGVAQRELMEESRKGLHDSSVPTQWVCLDLDRLATPNIDDALEAMGLGDISYIIQYSSSQGVFEEDEGTVSAHIFMMLKNPEHPQNLKNWLIDINLRLFRDQLTLNKDGKCLKYPLDISTCQNDKLLYIAAPKFINMADPISHRLMFEKRKHDTIEAIPQRMTEAIKQEAQGHMRMLREANGLPSSRKKDKFDGSHTIIEGVDANTVTGIKTDEEFVRLNVSGGKSWAYWHPVNNFKWIYSFKDSDVKYRTSEFLPDYYRDKMEDATEQQQTPNEAGDIILGFCDLPTARYFKGIYNEVRKSVQLWPARNETQINDWYLSHGVAEPDYIPQWTIYFDPRDPSKVDLEGRRINMYIPSPYFDVLPDENASFPAIRNHIMHMLGEDEKVYDHFINWFACIFQRKHKPLTAWVAHGVEGTGKGSFVANIAIPLLHDNNVMQVTAKDIEDNFNGFLEGKSFVFVDEVDVDDFREKGRVTAKLRNYITESKISVRKMRTQVEQSDNWTSWFFASNKRRPVQVPLGDRRYNIGIYQGKRMVDFDPKALQEDLEQFAAFLKAHPADPDLANSIVHTEDRDNLMQLSKTSGDEIADAILAGDYETLESYLPDDNLLAAHKFGMPYKQVLIDIKNAKRITRDQLYIIFEHCVGNVNSSPTKFNQYLRHHGLAVKQIKDNGGKVYGIHVKWLQKGKK